VRLGVLDLPAWTARGVLLGLDVAHAGSGPAKELDRARMALPGLYDRTPPSGSLSEVAPGDVAAGADLVVCRRGAAVKAACPVLAVDPEDEASWLIPEVVSGKGVPEALLLALGVARVDRLTAWGTTDPAALVGVLRTLRAAGQGAGRTIARTEALWPVARPDWSGPVVTADRVIPLDWTDYNGHMTEARYLHAFGDATDALMRMLGCDAAYIAAGNSFFTAETHIRHLGECLAGQRIRIDTRPVRIDGAKMHFFHSMWTDDRLVATGEHFMLHVSLRTRRPVPPQPPLDAGMARFGAVGSSRPEGVGRRVGDPR